MAIKKVLKIILAIIIIISCQLPLNQKTVYASPNSPKDNTWIQAASLTWLMDMSSLLYQLISTRIPSFASPNGLHMREQTIDSNTGQIQIDNEHRLLRWDRRPPNDIFLNGFIPRVTNQNLSPVEDTHLLNYLRTNSPSIFVSTTRARYNNLGLEITPWTPHSANNNIIYRYEIFAPGGIDINASFSRNHNPFPNEDEITFPGGIRPEFIRSTYEYHNGEIVRIWINPNFINPSTLNDVSGPSNISKVFWHENHSEGNNMDSKGFILDLDYNQDFDMFAPNGEIPNNNLLNNNSLNVIQNSEYQIKNKKDRNIVVTLDSDYGGSPVESYKNFGFENQKWNIKYDSKKNAYKIYNRETPTLLLSWNSNSSNGEQVIRGYTESGSNNQYWTIEKNVNGFYKFRNLSDPSKILDLKDGNTLNKTPLVVSSENSSSSQEWLIEKTNYQTVTDGTYQVSSKLNENKVIEQISTNKIHIFSNSDKENQVWNLIYNPILKAYKIKSLKYPNYSLAWDSNNTRTIVAATGDYNDQYWLIERNEDNTYIIRNYENRKIVLDLSNGSTTDGNGLLGFEFHGGINQRWIIKPFSFNSIQDGIYQFMTVINQDLIADLTTNNYTIATKTNNYSSNQKWTVTYNDKKRAYKIRNLQHAHLSLAWDSNHSDKIFGATGDYDDQYWIPILQTDGSFIFRNYKNPNKIFGTNGQPINDIPLKAQDVTGQNNQKWYLRHLNSSNNFTGYFNISSKKNFNKIITMNSNKTQAVIFDNIGINNQSWKLKYNDNKNAYQIHILDNFLYFQGGHNIVATMQNVTNDDLRSYWYVEYNFNKDGFIIRNAFDTSYVLDVFQGNFANNTPIITYQNYLNDNQLWNFIPSLGVEPR